MKTKYVVLFTLLFLVGLFINSGEAATADGIFDEALSLYQNKEYDKAAKRFHDASLAFEKNKNIAQSAESAYNSGLCYNQSDIDKALTAFERAAALYGKGKNAGGEYNSVLQAAEIYRKKQRLSDAHSLYMKAAAKAPQDLAALGYEGAAKIELLLGDLKKAQENARNAQKLFNSPQAKLRVRLFLAQILSATGDSAGATKEYADVLAESDKMLLDKNAKTKSDGEFLRFLTLADRGQQELNNGNYEAARGDFILALETTNIQPSSLRLVEMNRAVAEAFLGNIQLAQSLLNGLLKIASEEKNTGQIMMTEASLGQIARMDGQYKQAMRHFRKFQEIADSAGNMQRSTQAANQIADLYKHMGMYDESSRLFQHAFSQSLSVNDWQTFSISLLGIYSNELQSELGLSGKIDYKVLQGVPWRAAFSAESARNGAVDEGFVNAWNAVRDVAFSAYAPVRSIKGLRVVREMASAGENNRLEVKAGLIVADAVLRQTKSRLLSLNSLREAMEGLNSGLTPKNKDYLEKARSVTWNSLRKFAGEQLLLTSPNPLMLQLSGIRLVPINPDEADENELLNSDLKIIYQIVSRLSLKEKDIAALKKSLLAAEPIPGDILARLQKQVASEGGNDVAQILNRILVNVSPSLRSDVGKSAEGKLRRYIAGKEAKRLELLRKNAESLARNVSPYMISQFDSAWRLSEVLDAWQRTTQRVSLLAKIGVKVSDKGNWAKFIEDFSSTVIAGRKVFYEIKDAKKLFEMAKEISMSELLAEHKRLLSMKKKMSFDDELAMRELLGRFYLELGENAKAAELALDILEQFAVDESGAARLRTVWNAAELGDIQDLAGIEANPEIQWRAYQILSRAVGDTEKKFLYSTLAMELIEKSLPVDGAPTQLTADKFEVFGTAIDSAWKLWQAQKDPAAKKIWGERLWNLLERMKGRHWKELLSSTGGAFLDSMPKEKLEQLKRAERRIVLLEGAYRQSAFVGDRDRMKGLVEEIQKLRKERESIMSGSVAEVMDTPKPEELRKHIHEDWNVVNYYISKNLSFALLISKEKDVTVIPLDTDYDSLFGYAYWLRHRDDELGHLEYDDKKIRYGKQTPTVCGLSPQTAYAQVFAPLAEALGEKKNLLVIPHDILYVMPLEALQFADKNGNVKYLAEALTLAELPSASLIPLWEKNGSIVGEGLRVVASPLYGGLFAKGGWDASIWKNIIENSTSELGQRIKSKLGLDTNKNDISVIVGEAWEDIVKETTSFDILTGGVKSSFGRFIRHLYGTEEEAVVISQIMKKPLDSEAFFIGERASEKDFLASNPQGARYVHFACHGYDRGTIPDLQPGLALSPVNDPENDSFLQIGEIANIRWSAELITLSACDTGLGELYIGDGMFGLGTTLLASGAKGTVLTRWTASDESAPLFMKYLYEGIAAGKSPIISLRDAQLRFLEGKFEDYDSPRHWAIFKYVGRPW